MSRYRPLSAISTLVIHYSASPNGREVTAEDIDAWHKPRQFRRAQEARHGMGPWSGHGPHGVDLCCIGYHFVLRVSGVVEIGRRLTETGAHTAGHNHDTIGICMIGTDKFSAEQWRVLRRHVETTQAWRRKAGLPPVDVVGHRDLADDGRVCPGFDVRAWVAGGMQPVPGMVLE